MFRVIGGASSYQAPSQERPGQAAMALGDSRAGRKDPGASQGRPERKCYTPTDAHNLNLTLTMQQTAKIPTFSEISEGGR